MTASSSTQLTRSEAFQGGKVKNLKVDIKADDDRGALWPDLMKEPVQIGDIERFGVLQGGAGDGKTSVAFIVKTPSADGPVLVQISAQELRQMTAALEGAELRFGNKPETDIN